MGRYYYIGIKVGDVVRGLRVVFPSGPLKPPPVEITREVLPHQGKHGDYCIYPLNLQSHIGSDGLLIHRAFPTVVPSSFQFGSATI
jgi:hypothetical protein